MKTIGEEPLFSLEERLVALAHLYIELSLPFEAAYKAARADLAYLDGSELVAEAA